MLSEKEAKITGNAWKKLSELVRWSMDSSAMWLHMLLSSGFFFFFFFDRLTFPCMQLRKCKGAEWWDKYIKEHKDTGEAETFVARKLNDLAAYDGQQGDNNNRVYSSCFLSSQIWSISVLRLKGETFEGIAKSAEGRAGS